ncbi:MAG: diguanylate cyclase [Planctomycetota bacterium]|nr:diguanylate cyclase [Planctomycetota bacterium]MDP7251959.1 diguanylate cyclase [Planctomycetota bacterium]
MSTHSQTEIKPILDVRKRIRKLGMFAGFMTIVYFVVMCLRLVLLPPISHLDVAGMVLITTGAFLITWGLLSCSQYIAYNASPRTSRIVFRDEETGLFTSRYLVERLHDEISRASRHSTIFSVLFIRLQGMEKVQEEDGTKAAQNLWREISLTIRSVIRREDIPARWGSESVLLFLPNTEFLESYMLAERLESVLGAENLCRAENGAFDVVIGCATYPFDGNDVVGLVRFAEAAAHRNNDSLADFGPLHDRLTSLSD